MESLHPDHWVDNYADSLFSYAFFKTGKREVAEDLVQDTFLSAFQNKESFRGDSSEKTWLTSILKNKITDYYRKQSHAPSGIGEIFEDDAHFHQEDKGQWRNPVSANYISESPETYLFGKEFRQFLVLCLSKLPERLRAVFVARYLDEEKAENICKENDITPSNFWVMIFRAKVQLRECLEKRGIER